MDSEVKALLLGVDLHYRSSDDGIGQVADREREQKFRDALQRLTIDTRNLSPETLSGMLESGEEVVQWLDKHPQATVRLGYWSVSVHSPHFKDVDFERYDWPFGLNGAVEDFNKNRDGDGWSAEWSLC